MSAGRYFLCWVMAMLLPFIVDQQKWQLLAMDIGLMSLLIADALIDAIKEAGKK